MRPEKKDVFLSFFALSITFCDIKEKARCFFVRFLKNTQTKEGYFCCFPSVFSKDFQD